MAKTGQKFNKYTDEFKNKIIEEYLSNQGGAAYLSKKYNVSVNTVNTWLRKKINPDKYLKTGKRGRPTKSEEIDYKERYEILKNYQIFLKAQRDRK